MLLSVKNNDGKWVYTHTSLLDEQKVEHIEKVYERESVWKNWGSVLSLYGLLELVNRVPVISKLRFEYRAAAVAIPFFLARSIVAPRLYWSTTGNPEIRKLLNGAVVYDTPFEVPELDKMYYFLDDDQHYEPSLWHHGL